MLGTKTPPVGPADGGPNFSVTVSRATASGLVSQMLRCHGMLPAGTQSKQQGSLIMPLECWSATQRRSSGYCRSQNVTFGPVTPGKVCNSRTCHQEGQQQSTDTKDTAGMIVGTFLFTSQFSQHEFSARMGFFFSSPTSLSFFYPQKCHIFRNSLS